MRICRKFYNNALAYSFKIRFYVQTREQMTETFVWLMAY